MHKLIITGVICIALLTGKQALAAPQPGIAINNALKLLQENKPKEALTALERLITKSKPNLNALLIAGNAYMELDNYKKALELYEKGIKLYPNNLSIIQNKAVALYHQEDFIKAGDAFLALCKLQRSQKESKEQSRNTKNKAEKKSPPNWYSSQYQAGACYYKGEAYSKVLEVLKPLVSHHDLSAYTDTQQLIAHSYIAQKKWKQAASSLETLLKVHIDDRATWKLLAEVQIQQNKLKKAATALQIAYKLKKPTADESIRLARVYLQINSPLLAVASILDSQKDLTTRQLDLLSIAQEKSGRPILAEEALLQAIELKPTAKRHFELAKIYFRNQQYDAAIKFFEKTTEHKEFKAMAYYLLGQSYLEINETEHSRRMFTKALTFKKVRAYASNGIMLLDQKQRLLKEKQALYDNQ